MPAQSTAWEGPKLWPRLDLALYIIAEVLEYTARSLKGETRRGEKSDRLFSLPIRVYEW